MIVLIIWILLLFTPKSYAQSLSNGNVSIDSYRIDLQNNTSHASPAASPQPSQVFEESPASTGDNAFTFFLSPLLIDFGQLSPTNPTTRTVHVLISTKSTQGYTLQMQEEKELMSSSSAILPDTTCDSGRCTPQSAAAWENLLSFGLGYRCDSEKGNGCVPDFKQALLYKPFANKAKGHLPIVVIQIYGNKETQAKITYKLNISQTKDIKTYRNVINYVAVPNF